MDFSQYTEDEKIALIKNNGYQVQKIKVTTRVDNTISSSKVNFAYKEGVKYTIDEAFGDVILLLIENPASGSGAYTEGDGIDITGGQVSIDLEADPGLEFSGGQLKVLDAIRYTAAKAVEAIVAADKFLKNDATDETSGGLKASSFIVGAANDEVFHEGDEDWQTDATTTPTMNFSVSRNMELTPSTNATTLSFSNTHDGMSGVVVIDATDDGVLTLPTDSHPLTIAYANASRTVASFIKYGTEYIWESKTFAAAPL